MSISHNPIIDIVDMPNANGIYSYTLPADTRRFTIQVTSGRGTSNITLKSFRVAFYAEHLSSGKYWSVPAGMNYYETEIMSPQNNGTQDPYVLYLSSPTADATAEIFLWKG